MAASLTAVCKALAAAIQAVAPGQLQVEPTIGAILYGATPPYAHVYPCGPAGDLEYDQAMQRGLDFVPFTVEVFTGSPTDIGAQTNLLAFMDGTSPKCIKTALEVDTTLDGLVEDLQVVKCVGYHIVAGPRTGGVTPMLGSSWFLQVWLGDNDG